MAGTPAAPRRAALYVRISQDKSGTSMGVQRQETECRALAERLGWDVVNVYVDNDREASSGKARPAYMRLLADMVAGNVDAVVGWHSDRIYRRPDELEHLITLADRHDVLFAAVVVGNIDLSTASGRMIARMLGAAAKYETELKGERQAAQLQQRRAAGLPTGGGSRPFGWQPGGMVLQDDEAAIVRALVDRAASGERVGALAEWLTAQGITSVSGKEWHPTVVRRLLLNPRLAGLMTHGGTVVGRARWEPIIDEATHHRLVAVLTYKGPARRNTGRVAILPGIIWCGGCGFELVTFRQQRGCPPPGVRTYGCRTKYMPGRGGHLKSCGAISVRGDSVEADVAERVLARLLRPATAAALAAATPRPGSAPSSAVAELSAAEERLRSLGVDYADGLLGRTEFLAARDRLSSRIDDLRRVAGQPKRLPDVPYGDAEGLTTWWEGATLAKRQALVRQTIERVEVGPHTGRRSHYDPTRLTIIWA